MGDTSDQSELPTSGANTTNIHGDVTGNLLSGTFNAPVNIGNTQNNPAFIYEQWREQQNSWLLECFSSLQTGKAYFGQQLNVLDPATRLIARAQIWDQMDQWLVNWKSNHRQLVVIGEEGDGKTWSVASWIAQKLQSEPSMPAILFFASNHVQASDVDILLEHQLARGEAELTTDQIEQAIRFFKKSDDSVTPAIVIVLDGINQHGDQSLWRTVFQQLLAKPWYNKISVIITCRASHWKENYVSDRALAMSIIAIPSYNDSELEMALSYHNLHRADIRSDVLPLIKKPRYFDLTIRLLSRLPETGDVTVPRLIYEDWRDRWERNNGTPLTAFEFQEVLRKFALLHQKSPSDDLQDEDLLRVLPAFKKQQQVYDELRTGGILDEHQGLYTVRKLPLAYGLGLLLVREVDLAYRSSRNLEEEIARWLEPQSEMDIKGQICEFAALHALTVTDIDIRVKAALLQAWVNSLNPNKDIEQTLTAYLPVDPEAYVRLAELEWSDKLDNARVQEILLRAFIHWSSSERVMQSLISTLERWLGYVPIYGWPVGRDDEERLEKQKIDIETRLGFELGDGPISVAGYPLTAIRDDGLVRLSRAGLAIISHLPRALFIRAITIGCIVEAIVGRSEKYDLFRWILLTSTQTLSVEVAEVAALLIQGTAITQLAAYRLLSYEGSQPSELLRSTIPETVLPPRSQFALEHLRDPCNSYFAWSSEDCAECLKREDLDFKLVVRKTAPHCIDPFLPVSEHHLRQFHAIEIAIHSDELWIVFGQTGADHELDTFEPMFARFVPQKFATFMRDVMLQIATRTGAPRRQMAFYLNEYSLLFGDRERIAIREAWLNLVDGVHSWGEAEETAETFLYRQVFIDAPGDMQFSFILQRPDRTREELRNRRHFAPIRNWQIVTNALTDATTDDKIIRILWFISAHTEAIPVSMLRDQISPLLESENDKIRSLVLEIIYRSSNQQVIDALINRGWGWSSTQSLFENHWGSLLLAEFGLSVPTEDLLRRVHPKHLGFAILNRGSLLHEIDLFAHLIHGLWERTSHNAPNIPDDMPDLHIVAKIPHDPRYLLQRSLPSDTSQTITIRSPGATWGGFTEQSDPLDMLDEKVLDAHQERLRRIVNEVVEQQEAVDNIWFGHDFYAEDIELIVEHHTELVAIWLQVLENSESAARQITRLIAFYEALCAALLKRDAEKGIMLYKRIRDNRSRVRQIDDFTKLEILDIMLFQATPNEAVMLAWTVQLEECTTDEELFKVAFLAQSGLGRDWLWSYIEHCLASSIPIEQARSLTLLGFIDTDQARMRAEGLCNLLPDTWLREIAKYSEKHLKRNAWAQYWFRLFLTEPEDVDAWAAFRLFLRCVDGRFRLWWKKIEADVGKEQIDPHRMVFLRNNIETIQKSVRANNEELAKHFLGQKVQHRQVWPWLVN